MKLIVAYSSDNNYVQHVGVSMISLFENNKEFDEITVYIIENNISKENREKLKEISRRYNRHISYVNFDNFSGGLQLNINNSISTSTYARLLISSMLPDEVSKIIYLDCDSIVSGSLMDLWETDISEYYIAGVLDTVSDETKLQVGLDINSSYINAGMILINIKKWRKNNIVERFIKFIKKYNGNVFHHDQGTINGVLHEQCLVLHPRYNSMTVFFTLSREQIMEYYSLKNYYSSKELKEAVENPVFVHYTPAFAGRPWIKGCRHPLALEYRKYLNMTLWKEVELTRDTRKLREKIVSFLYNHIQFKIAHGICKLIFNH